MPAGSPLAFLVAAGVLYLALLVPLFVLQRHLLYFPAPMVEGAAAFGLEARTLQCATVLGEPFVAWYAPAPAGQPLILFFHGNGGNLSNRVGLLRQFAALGWGYLAIDYPGYGASPGQPTEPALMRAGQSAYAKAVDLGYAAKRIVVFGESLGSGIAVQIAAAHPVKALVLDSAFTATVDIAAAQYWMFPVRLLMRDQYRSRDAIGLVAAPKLFLHAEEDPVVPIAFDRELFAMAREPKTFVAVEGRHHVVADLAFEKIVRWLAALPQP